MRADLGVMISASTTRDDNGIKFFGPDGFKLSDAAEAEIEALVARGRPAPRPRSAGPSGSMTAFTAMSSGSRAPSRGMRLDGMKVVIDCAHGAAYRAAPDCVVGTGRRGDPVGVRPDGHNINLNCGSTAPRTRRRR
jgi:phosphoglucosamine mutase